MDKSQQKTVLLTPRSGGGGGPLTGNALPNGYVLQGRYVIEKQLGAGGFGITYLAKHRYLEDIWVAIKEYLPEGAAVRDESSHVHPISAQHDKIYNWGLHRFLDEARLLRQFKHTNIVGVEDFFEANDTAYLVMNYVQGRSIQAELDNGRTFSESDLRVIVYQLLDALKLIHRDGLYHRDISPDNILLREEDDAPVLIDFGSARYEMRMRGAEQHEDAEGHTPTTIFKPGYSPVEQYEGTTQGPYTDIYALAATLYRTAFGVRPVDSLKRSGELRLTNQDPLTPASERGKGRFSDDFLETIDIALRVNPEDRPQTIEDWLDHLKDHPELAPPKPVSQASPPPGRRWPGLVLAALLGGIAAGGFYWWQISQEPVEPKPGDIPSMLAAANREFTAGPFDANRQTRAGALYRRVLNLDGFNDEALAGLNAARLLQNFEEALKQEDRAKAVVLLGDIEKEFRAAGIDVKKLDNGWQRLERIRKKQSLRNMLPLEPLSQQTWNKAAALLGDIRKLPGGAQLADHGTRALGALRATDAALQQQDFTVARKQLGQAVSELKPFGIEQLPTATALIDERQKQFEAKRQAKIVELMQSAEQDLAADPLQRASIEQARRRIKAVLTMDENNSTALARDSLLTKMLAAYDQIAQDSFDPARASLAAARKIASNAGFDTGPLDRADAYLTQRQQAWKTSETRKSLARQFEEAAQLLGATPLDKAALERATAIYQQALQTSADTAVFGAEHKAAIQGAELTDRFTAIGNFLSSSAFVDARTALTNSKTEELARDAGLGPTALQRVAKAVDQQEGDWQRKAALALLNGEAPLADKTLSAVHTHLARLRELAPDDKIGSQLTQALKQFDASNKARQQHDYAAAVTQLQQAIETFSASGINNPNLQTAKTALQSEAAAWDAQQRESRISAMLQQAFSMLHQQPLSTDTQAAVEKIFDAVGKIQDGKERAVRGNRLLAALRTVTESMSEARFEQAIQALDQADALLTEFGEAKLDKARRVLETGQRKWLESQTQQRREQLAEAAAMLRKGPLNEQLLKALAQTFQAIGTLNQGADTASAGQALIGQLRQALKAIDQHSYPQADAWLDKATAQLPAAGLPKDLLNSIRTDTTRAAARFTEDEAAKKVETLRDKAAALIRGTPLDNPSLKQASDALREALDLDRTLPKPRSQADRLTSGLETVVMLRAFNAELKDHQYDAIRKTVAALAKLLPQAALDPSLVAQLQRTAQQSEADWRLEKLQTFIQQGNWQQTRDLSPAMAQLDALDALPSGNSQVTLWHQVVKDLQQTFAAQTQRHFDEALESLAAAQTGLQKLAVEITGLVPLRQRIASERDRWHDLSVERSLITWTGQAVAMLDRQPFEPKTWTQVESLAKQILEARANDERGLALQSALSALRQAGQMLQAGQFGQATEQAQLARKALATLGIEHPLKHALADIDQQKQQFSATRLHAVASLLDGSAIDDARLEQARTDLQQILQHIPNQPTASTAIEALGGITAARQAMAATRYIEAADRLAQAGEKLDQATTSGTAPLPALHKLLQETRKSLAAQQPSPAEIYPIVSVALRKINQTPLDPKELDAAQTLLHNALGLQADDPSALGGISAIGYLRETRRAIDNKDAAAAREGLQKAEAALERIGLSAGILQKARDAVDALPP